MGELYNQETYGKHLDDHEHTIRAALGDIAPHVFYSAYDTDPETGEPINNLNEVAIKGKCILIAEADAFWGDKDSADYFSPVLENPTWLEVSVFANAAIIATRDFHHHFLEGVNRTGILNDDDVPFYTFAMGS